MSNATWPRWWVPAALGAGRAAALAARAVQAVRDEALAARLTTAEQEQMTLTLYARTQTYGPGGSAFDGGLFPWEEAVFSGPDWPGLGRVLVGAAGAGREALALARRGYEVTAFEPCASLAAQGHRLAMDTPGLRFLTGSYADMVAAAAGHGGPLADLAGPFDAVVLGWGGLSHVLAPAAREALLRAACALAPGGPVLASFLVAWPRGAAETRARNALRRVFGASAEAPYFSPDAGFFHLFTAAEIAALAAAADCSVSLYRETPYPHALFSPRRP